MKRRDFLRAGSMLTASALVPIPSSLAAAPPLGWYAQATAALNAGLSLQACMIVRAAMRTDSSITSTKEFVRISLCLAYWLRDRNNYKAFLRAAQPGE